MNKEVELFDDLHNLIKLVSDYFGYERLGMEAFEELRKYDTDTSFDDDMFEAFIELVKESGEKENGAKAGMEVLVEVLKGKYGTLVEHL